MNILRVVLNVAIRERALGPEHPDTASSLNNLALLLKDLGDLEGARPLYERALANGVEDTDRPVEDLFSDVGHREGSRRGLAV